MVLRGEMAFNVGTADGVEVTLLARAVTLEATVEGGAIACLFKRSLNR